MPYTTEAQEVVLQAAVEFYLKEKTDAAMEQLLITFSPWVKKVCWHFFPDREFQSNLIDIEDLTQVALLRLYQTLPDYENVDPTVCRFTRFVYKRLKYACMNHITTVARPRVKVRMVSLDRGEGELEKYGWGAEDLTEPSFVEEVDDLAGVSEIVRSLKQLNPRHKEALLLHLQGLTPAQAAKALGVTPIIFSKRKHRLRARIRELMGAV